MPDVRQKVKDFLADDETAAFFKAVVGDLEQHRHEVAHVVAVDEPQAKLTTYLQSGHLDAEGLRRDVVDLFPDEDGPEGLAVRFVEAVQRHGHKAPAAERDASRFIARQTAEELIVPRLDRLITDQQQTQAAMAGVIAGPARQLGVLLAGRLDTGTQELLRDLHDSDPAAAAALIDHLAGDTPDTASLVLAPPAWVQQAAAALWSAVGQLLARDARWDLAEQAHLTAADRPGADRALSLVRAADCARLAGASGRAADYLNRAAVVDAGHLSVRLAQIAGLEDPQQRIAEREQLRTSDDRQRATLLLALADDLSLLGRFDDATASIDERIVLRPDSLAGLDRRAGLRLIAAKRKLADGMGPDRPLLRSAADDSLRVREMLLNQTSRRSREAGGLLARAAEASALAGDFSRFDQLLDEELTPAETADRDVRRDLADAAVQADALPRALTLLGPEAEWTVAERAVAAQALAQDADPQQRRRGHQIASDLLAEDPACIEAALALSSAAIEDLDLPWSQPACDLLAEHNQMFADGLRAARLAAEGRIEEAEGLLLRHPDSIPAQRSLAGLALDREQWRRAHKLTDRLLIDAPRHEDHLMRARALEGLGDVGAAREDLRVVAGDNQADPSLRVRACNKLLRLAHGSDLAEIAQASGWWLDANPAAIEPVWNRASAWARMGREAEALELIDSSAVEVRNRQQAREVAMIASRALDDVPAARRIAELSDRFDREDEVLEGLLIVASRRIEQYEDPELEQRVRATWAQFTSRFPNSTMLWEVWSSPALVDI